MDDTALFEELINVNKHRLVPEGSPLPKIVNVAVGKKQFSREDMYHRSVSVTCDISGKISCLKLWVKHRPGIHEAFAPLDSVYNRIGEGIFPKPILEWHSLSGGNSLLLMARVEGKTLRSRLMKAALFRRTDKLMDIFGSNGAKMRKFHDASESFGAISTEQFVAQARGLVERTSFFSASEKPTVLRHVQAYGRMLRGLPALPLRQIHHDWTLRNVLVDERGVDYLVDFDSLRAPASSRWLEVTCLLLNLESQGKWAPVITRHMLSKLWSSFWRGYALDKVPECSASEIPAVFYLARLHHLLGGTFRVPLFEKHRRVIDKRFLLALKKSVLEGQYTLLTWSSGHSTVQALPNRIHVAAPEAQIR
jgi:hypothetical protein